VDAWEGIEAFLEPGREVLVARNGDEVAQFVDSVDAEQAQAIGSRARERMLAQHTYAQRAAQVERVLQGRSLVAA
jgi:spore maturation protein CgeB